MKTASFLSIFTACVLVATAGSAAADSEEPALAPFLIGIEDVLEINTWGEEELILEQKVRPDGKITVPLINDVFVVGLTPEEVAERITQKLGEFIRDPNVTVGVKEINSFRVYFLGEVQNQGPQQFYRPTRLLQGLASAGGPTDFAKDKIVLFREDNGVERRIEFDYKQLIAGNPNAENLFLQSGDTVVFK